MRRIAASQTVGWRYYIDWNHILSCIRPAILLVLFFRTTGCYSLLCKLVSPVAGAVPIVCKRPVSSMYSVQFRQLAEDNYHRIPTTNVEWQVVGPPNTTPDVHTVLASTRRTVKHFTSLGSHVDRSSAGIDSLVTIYCCLFRQMANHFCPYG